VSRLILVTSLILLHGLFPNVSTSEPAFRGIETVLDLEGEETNRDEKTAGLTTKRRKRRRRERERATSVSRCFNAGHFFPFNSFSILFRPNRSCSVPRATISISPRVSFVDQASRAERERERERERGSASAYLRDRRIDRAIVTKRSRIIISGQLNATRRAGERSQRM